MVIIQSISAAKLANQFNKYIDYIRYPKFKNLIKGTKITFDFPITVFVGKNGSGKSSVLKSLYGCVEGNNISDYWFSTTVDPIEQAADGENRNCFIYNYPSPAEEANYEVLIQRAPRDGNPDYWETAKPVVKYNMQRDVLNENYRKQKLQCGLLYLDFHAVISAFDKYRYFLESERVAEANRYLRAKSKYLSTALRENRVLRQGNPKAAQNELPLNLNQHERTEISKILGKSYGNTRVVKHKFFKL